MRIAITLIILTLMSGWASAQQGQGSHRSTTTSPLWSALDLDKSGDLSAEEIAKASESLAKLEKSKNGKIGISDLGRAVSRRRRPAPAASDSIFVEKTHARTEDVQKILDVLDDLNRNHRRGNMNVPVEDGQLLRVLAEMLGAKHVVEIGTSNGYSAIWLCLALRATGGKLTTYEIDERRATLARENFKRAGVDHLVTLVEGDAHKEVTQLKDPIDLLFLDADKEGYVDYLNKLLPLMSPGGVIVAHNMNTRQADPQFVKAITTNKDLETLFVHMDHAGVSISLKKR